MVFAMLIASVVAVPALADANDLDAQCARGGFDFGIADWGWKGGQTDAWELKSSMNGSSTLVTGTNDDATWTSVPDAAGVLITGVSTPYPGGASGNIVTSNINNLVICGNAPDVPDVPEFGMIAAGLVMAAGVGLVVFRRK
jgi:hypothetical protein